MAAATASPTAQPRKRRQSKPKVSSPPSVPTTSLPDDLESVPPSPSPKTLTYVARKKMKVNGRQLKPGDEVPEALDWLRVESWVRAGYLNEEWR